MATGAIVVETADEAADVTKLSPHLELVSSIESTALLFFFYSEHLLSVNSRHNGSFFETILPFIEGVSKEGKGKPLR